MRRLGESYQQTSDLLRAGVPLTRCLRLLAGRKKLPALASLYRELAESVESGSELAAAMAEKPQVFETVHVAMVRAGEKGGFLEEVLGKLGALVIKQANLRSKVMTSLIYPALLVVVGILIGGLIFGFLVPKFRPMFAKLGDNLPFVSKVVFAMSDAVGKYGLVSLGVFAILVVVIWRAAKVPEVRRRLEIIKTHMPIIGPVVRGFATARLCSLLGTMLSNGVPMLTALSIAKEGAGNMLIQNAIERSIDSVRSGQPLAPELETSGLFDDDVIEVIRVGEAANNLDDVLVTAALTLEARLDMQLMAAVRLIEPLMLIIISGVVGMVAAGLLLPLSNLSSAL